MAYCVKCGNKMENDAKFCDECGSSVVGNSMSAEKGEENRTKHELIKTAQVSQTFVDEMEKEKPLFYFELFSSIVIFILVFSGVCEKMGLPNNLFFICGVICLFGSIFNIAVRKSVNLRENKLSIYTDKIVGTIQNYWRRIDFEVKYSDITDVRCVYNEKLGPCVELKLRSSGAELKTYTCFVSEVTDVVKLIQEQL